MKKLAQFLFALCFAPCVWAAGSYQEGVHYKVIAEQGTTKPEVKEFFSFYCGACNAMDPIVRSMSKSLPEGVLFKKYHVDFMGQASPEIQTGLTAALALAKAKGKGDEVNKAFFDHIHTKRQPFADLAAIKAVAVAAGLDATHYDKEVASFMVKSHVKLVQKEQKSYSDRKILTSVPTFIVNGRFRIDNSKLDPKNTEQDLKDLVNYLLNK